MKLYRRYILYISICLGLLISPFCSGSAEAKDFVVVIDPGHGGHDPGAVGKISKEKNINLNVALKLGKQIKKNCPDVKVIYTRDRDIFIPLDRRAEIANNAKADCSFPYIPMPWPKTDGQRSLHLDTGSGKIGCQSGSSQARKMPLSSTKATTRRGMPASIPTQRSPTSSSNSCRTKYMSQSVHLASLVQKHFRQTCKTYRPGACIRQVFLVLRPVPCQAYS